MLFDLTNTQIKILIHHDPDFLDVFLNAIPTDKPIAMHPVLIKARQLAKDLDFIPAIKELREWSDGRVDLDPYVTCGPGKRLGLAQAKDLIEKFIHPVSRQFVG